MNVKLSLELLCSEIEILSAPVLASGHNHKLTLYRCAFYQESDAPDPGTLYMLTEEQCRTSDYFSFSADENYSLLLPYEAKLPKALTNLSYTWPTENASYTEAVNQIFRVFEKYDSLDRKLTECILRGDSLASLVSASFSLFDNEITIRDSDHRYVATSFDTILFYANEEEKQPDPEGYSSIEEINLLKQHANYTEQSSSAEPFLYLFGQYCLLCIDVYLDQLFLYRIKISDALHPLRPYDSEILKYFSELVLRQYLANRPGTRQSNKELRRCIPVLLERREYISENELSASLGSIGWQIGDTYLVICVKAGQNHGVMKAYSYYSRYLEQNIQDIICVEWADELVVIGNLSRGYHGSAYLLSRTMVEYIRDENCRAGISDPCPTLLSLYPYYCQAHAALSEGLKHDPAFWTYPFSKYRFHYLKQDLESVFPDCIMLLPGLEQLYRSDHEKATEHIRTLKVYLTNGGNMARASRLLNIHHSTLTYRLERIFDILGFSPEDFDTLLWLQLLIRLKEIDQENAHPEENAYPEKRSDTR